MSHTREVTHIEWRVRNLDCENEAAQIRRGLEKLPGLQELKIYSSAAKVAAIVDTELLPPETLKHKLEALGFPVSESREIAELPKPWKNPKVITSAISGLLLGIAFLLEKVGVLPTIPAYFIYGIAVITGGYFFGREAIQEFVAEFAVGIEMLMSVAAIVAFILGQPAEAATLVFLYSISEAAEGYTEERTRSAIRALMDLTPKTALVIRDGNEIEIPAEELRVGDRFIIKPGGAIPTDGLIKKGRSSLNEASVTGESIPVEKREGDLIFAGTINETGALEVEATKTFQDNTISRIIDMVEEAQEEKGEGQKLIDRFGRKYSPSVFVIGALIALVPPLLGAAWGTWAIRATVFMVSAAPCALVISVPITIVAAIGTASRRGVLIKGGVYVEQLAATKVLCLDKTGTLTRGTPEVTDIVPLNGTTPRHLLALAASAEKRSEHPLAKAILRRAQFDEVMTTEPQDFEALTGAGLRAQINGETIFVAKPSFFENSHRDDFNAHRETIAQLQAAGKTVVIVGNEKKLLGVLAIRDEVRPNAREAIAALHEIGLKKIVMLTGDNTATAKAIADEVGIDEFYAELKPEDKTAKIKELQQLHGKVAMVGDGVNDAPALAAAAVGIAMGAAGTDVALETADVALMADDLSKLKEAFQLSRRAQKLIRQNLWLSIIVIVTLVIGALTGIFTLPIAVLAHEVSEFAVIGNGLRMLKS
ncbi:cadmium-translocating P-type ATPase [candidate division KSB1 bacterium]|nr:MAG: cadmium-translocating P-type ATPase [candidate division KSB1 bacterium]